MTTDEQLHDRISALVAEEHRLRQALTDGDIDEGEEHRRLRGLEESLDQAWDLLRRREAARASGADPGQVQARSVNQVEGYLQ